jgi:hypothetical protein
MVFPLVRIASAGTVAAIALATLGCENKQPTDAPPIPTVSIASAPVQAAVPDPQPTAEVPAPGPSYDPGRAVETFRARTARATADPGTAQFRDLKLNSSNSALCGSINVKDASGQYIGYRGFVTTQERVYFAPAQCDALSADLSPKDRNACWIYKKDTGALCD